MSAEVAGQFDRAVDSVYFGGGTPTVLDSTQLERIFVTIRENFDLQPDSEITVECAPGTLTPAVLEVLQRCGVNRVSLGVQSFIDQEAASVGRQHKRATVLGDISQLRDAGIREINVDLIAGLPHQTRESWAGSLDCVLATGVPHVSVYMLEVDEDSRLGRELIAGGVRYHAHGVPDEDLIAEFYECACKLLDEAGVRQYEISNFARDGHESKHNLKYWTRQPYLGVGMDAHSMLRSQKPGVDAIRFSMPDTLEQYEAGDLPHPAHVSVQEALEETFFLGLRLTRGVHMRSVEKDFGREVLRGISEVVAGCIAGELIKRCGDVIRLTARGRMLSNEVFERFVSVPLTAE